MARQVFKRGQGYPDQRLMHPRREWSIGLGIFAIVVAFGALMSAQEYTRYTDLGSLEPTEVVKVVSYDEASVNQALEIYRERAQVYEALTKKDITITPVSTTPATTTEPAATSTDPVSTDDTEEDTSNEEAAQNEEGESDEETAI